MTTRRRDAQLSAMQSRLQETRDELTRADGKVATLLAAAGVIAGVLLAAMIAGDWSPSVLAPCLRAGWWLGAAAWLLAIGALGYGLYPRTKRRGAATAGGRFFYGDVHSSTADSVLAELAQPSAGEIRRLADQVVQVSMIVQVKYRSIQLALWALGIGGLLMLVSGTLDTAWASVSST